MQQMESFAFDHCETVCGARTGVLESIFGVGVDIQGMDSLSHNNGQFKKTSITDTHVCNKYLHMLKKSVR